MVEGEFEVDDKDLAETAVDSFVNLIKETDCADYYRDCLNCKYATGDWKSCIRQVTALKKCFRTYWVKRREEEEFLRAIAVGVMLSEVFGHLSIADECVSEKVKTNISDIKNPFDYLPLDNSKCWFLGFQKIGDNRELLRLIADYKYFEKDYDVALKYYQRLFETGEHKASYKFSILDSIIRTALKGGSMSRSSLDNLLHNCCLPLVVNLGEQLQFWNLCVKVYSGCDEYVKKYFKSCVLLCDVLDTVESWENLAVTNIGDIYENFRLGCLIRGLRIAEGQMRISHGFMLERMQLKVLNLKATIEESYSKQTIKSAEDHMCVDLQISSFQSVVDIDERPVYNCQILEKLKSVDEQRQIVIKFIKKFSWLFNGKINDIMSYIGG